MEKKKLGKRTVGGDYLYFCLEKERFSSIQPARSRRSEEYPTKSPSTTYAVSRRIGRLFFGRGAAAATIATGTIETCRRGVLL